MQALFKVLWAAVVCAMLVGCTGALAAEDLLATPSPTSALASQPALTPAPVFTPLATQTSAPMPARTPVPTLAPAVIRTPTPTSISTQILAFAPAPFVPSQVDDYSSQYRQLLAHVNGQRLAHHVVQVDLANHPKTNQYASAITTRYGYNACGLVAAADSYYNSRDVIAWIRQAAEEAYGNDTGIQPTRYTKALQTVFGENNVQAENGWTLDEMYQALSRGDIVIVDIQVREDAEVPSISRPNYSHFARVLGIDLDSGRIYIENTLHGQSYWDIPLSRFWETWKFPETAVSIIRPGAEAVTRWAVLIRQGAAPYPPLVAPVL